MIRPQFRHSQPFRIVLTALALATAIHLPLLATDRSDVESVIQSAYFEGVHRDRDGAAMRLGFHESFRLLILRDGELSSLGIEEWIERIESWKTAEPKLEYETHCKLVQLDITEDVAVAKVEVTRDGALVFTDYLALHHFEDGWKIVSKSFHDHR